MPPPYAGTVIVTAAAVLPKQEPLSAALEQAAERLHTENLGTLSHCFRSTCSVHPPSRRLSSSLLGKTVWSQRLQLAPPQVETRSTAAVVAASPESNAVGADATPPRTHTGIL